MSDLKNRSPAMDKYRVTLDGEERAMLERLVTVGKAASGNNLNVLPLSV
jgi:hypothetical protein